MSYNAFLRKIGREFLQSVRSGAVGFLPICESTVRPIVFAFAEKVVSKAVALFEAIKLLEDEKLEVLRRLDQFRQWHSLEEKRYCLVCGNLIAGQQIQVAGGTRGNGPLRLNCPTEQCNSIPMDWVLPTDEILAKVEKMAVEERKAAEPKPAAVTIPNGHTPPLYKPRYDFMSRVLKFVLPSRRQSKAVPSNPCGP